jgi:hypothetical protein
VRSVASGFFLAARWHGRGGKRGQGGSGCGTAWRRKRGREGGKGGGRGSAMWTGTAWTRWLRAALTVVDGTRLVGVARTDATGEGGGGVSDAGAGG